MRVLITGVAGFVGRYFTRKLLEKDDNEVVGIDNLSAGTHPDDWATKPRALDRFTFKHRDMRSILHAYHPGDFDLVIHCAAVVGGRLLIEGDPLKIATDLAIDADLFNWVVRDKHMPKLVYFSSSAVYPIELQTRTNSCKLHESLQGFTSTRVGLPDLTYGYVKLTGEYLAKFAHEQYGLDVRIYRPFGGYGEEQSFDYPFPSIIRRVLDGDNPVVVWGSGEQKRDFIHIDDVVECVLYTMQRPELAGKALNIGTGVGTSFIDLARRAQVVLGRPGITITHDNTKPEGVFSRVADAYQMLQYYKPQVTLDEGIRRVAQSLDRAKVLV
jgi:nucleoside-diphosphate-sugar epimerase